ncbi:MAG: hypothetical protein ACLPPF_15230 [Rhodomicrobium sp.]
MLHDLRGDYIRREEPGFFERLPAAIRNAAIWSATLIASGALLWVSLKYGESTAMSEPLTYFPWITPGAE